MRNVQVDHRDGGNRDARAEVAFSTPPYKATGVAESGGNQLSISNWLDQRLRNPPSAATRAAAAAAAAATRRCGRSRPPVGTIHARSTLRLHPWPALALPCRQQHQSDGHLPPRRCALAPLRTLAAKRALPRPLTPKPPSATASPVVAFPISAAPAAANRTNGPGYGRPPQRAAPKLSWPPRQGDAAGRPVSPGPPAGRALRVEAGPGGGAEALGALG